MKPYLNFFGAIALFSLLVPAKSYAQEPQKLSDFTLKNGAVVTPRTEGVDIADTGNFTGKDSAQATAPQIAATKIAIYDKLKEAALQTLDTLNDEQNQLNTFYTQLWGAQAVNNLKIRLATLIKHFSGGGLPKIDDDPSMKCLDDLIDDYATTVYSRMYGKYLARQAQIEVDVYENDAFATFLQLYIKTCLEKCPPIPYSNEFVQKKHDLIFSRDTIGGVTYFQQLKPLQTNESIDTLQLTVPPSDIDQNGFLFTVTDNAKAPLAGCTICLFRSLTLFHADTCQGANYMLTTNPYGNAYQSNVAKGTYYANIKAIKVNGFVYSIDMVTVDSIGITRKIHTVGL